MPHFVLLYHECPPHYERPSHWDLMLEAGDSLRTWAVPYLPRAWNATQAQTAALYPDCPPAADENSVAAQRLADHRLDYLDKQGPLSGNRGHVSRIDRGNFEGIEELPGYWQLTLTSGNWRGRIELQQNATDTIQWTLTVDQPEG